MEEGDDEEGELEEADLEEGQQEESQADEAAVEEDHGCAGYDVTVMLHDRIMIDKFWGGGTQNRWIGQAAGDKEPGGCNGAAVSSCLVLPTLPMQDSGPVDDARTALSYFTEQRKLRKANESCLAVASMLAAGHVNRATPKTLSAAYYRASLVSHSLYVQQQ